MFKTSEMKAAGWKKLPYATLRFPLPVYNTRTAEHLDAKVFMDYPAQDRIDQCSRIHRALTGIELPPNCYLSLHPTMSSGEACETIAAISPDKTPCRHVWLCASCSHTAECSAPWLTEDVERRLLHAMNLFVGIPGVLLEESRHTVARNGKKKLYSPDKSKRYGQQYGYTGLSTWFAKSSPLYSLVLGLMRVALHAACSDSEVLRRLSPEQVRAGMTKKSAALSVYDAVFTANPPVVPMWPGMDERLWGYIRELHIEGIKSCFPTNLVEAWNKYPGMGFGDFMKAKQELNNG